MLNFNRTRSVYDIMKLRPRDLLVLLMISVPQAQADMGHEGVLAKHLFANYSLDTRPVDLFSTTVKVKITFILGKIERLEEKNQLMISFGWIKQDWYDEHLNWDPQDYGNTEFLVIPSEKVWRPEVVLYNSMENYDDSSFYTKSRVRISPAGLVTWNQGHRWVSQCTMKLRYFPFDTQECSLGFLNWQHTERLLNFTNASPVVAIGPYVPNGEWDLLSATTYRTEEGHNTNYIFPLVGFTLALKRIPTYFMYSILIPELLLSILTGLVFLLPNEAGEKISMQMTILLSHSVMLLVVSDTTPRSATTAPILTEFMVSTMSLSAASLIATVFTLNMYHHRATKPIPRWLRKLCLGCMGRLVLIRMDCKMDKDRVEALDPKELSPSVDDEQEVTRTTDKKEQSHALPKYIKKYILEKIKAAETNAILSSNREEWQLVSVVFDRVFFLCYAATLIVMLALASQGSL